MQGKFTNENEKAVNERANDPDARPMLYDPIQSSKTTKTNQYLATIILCLCATAAGTGLSWTSPALKLLQNETTTVLPTTKVEGTWIASFLPIGALVGSLAAGVLAEKIGRKYTAIAIGFPYIIGWALIITAKAVFSLYAARFLIGISTGGSCVVAPMFISEYAETSIRGLLGTCFQLFLTIGILIVYVVGAVATSPTGWIQLSWICAVVPVLYVLGLFLVPESPVWLMKNGRQNDAAAAIKWYWGKQCNANAAIQAIQSDIDSSGGSGSIGDLFTVKANRNGFAISLMLMFFQQFSGINAVIFFAEKIFESTGSTMSPAISSIIIGVVQVIMTFASTVLVERAGRKILLLQSSTIMCLCLTSLGAYFYLKSNGTNVSSIGLLPLISLVLFIITFSLGYGPIPWMMMGELLAPEVKSIATSFTVLFNWISVFVITKSFEPLLGIIGDAWTFWIFAIIMALGTVCGLKFVFETKGKSNAQIQMTLAGQK